MFSYIRSVTVLLLCLTLVTGGIYPLIVTSLAQLIFPQQANGSVLMNAQGQPIGSILVGQSFSAPNYFWSRPSATAPYANNAAASMGSNLGPTNPELVNVVAARISALKALDPENTQTIPVDLVTASASGLDPHISVAAAEYQINRIAKQRRLATDVLRALVVAHTEGRQWGIFGEPRVNVLKLNLALDATVH